MLLSAFSIKQYNIFYILCSLMFNCLNEYINYFSIFNLLSHSETSSVHF